MAASDVYEAVESYAVEVDGVPTVVHASTTRVRGDHPLYKNNPDLWKLVDTGPTIEAATATPGEKRGAVGGVVGKQSA